MRTWRKEPVKSSSGAISWRLVAGRGDDRVRVNLSRISEVEADRALVTMQRLDDEGAGARALALIEADPERGRTFLLVGDPAETELLPPAPVDYGAMTVAEYFIQVYWPARHGPESDPEIRIADKTAKEEKLYWRHTGHDKAGNVREKRGILDGEIGGTRMRAVDDQLWETWQSAQTHLSPRSKAIRRNAYAALLSFARRKGHTKFKPEFFRIRGSTKRTREQVDTLTIDEVLALLKVADSCRRAMWAVGVGQGLRPGELVRVHWEDIQWDTRTMLVRGTKTEDAWDTVPMTPLAYRELQAYWTSLAKPKEGWAFTYGGRGKKSQPAKAKPFVNYKKALAGDALKAGITRKVTPYLLRHSFATIAYLIGVEKDVTRRIGRWTDTEMLDRVYTRPRPADLVVRLSAFDVL